MKKVFGIIAVAGMAATASAQYGIVFTQEAAGGGDNLVEFLDAGLSRSTLVNYGTSFDGADISIGDIIPVGSSWYVSFGRIEEPAGGSTSRIVEITDLFGTPSSSVIVDPTDSSNLQGTLGLGYHAASDNLISIQNTGSASDLMPRFDGVLASDFSGATTTVYAEPTPQGPTDTFRDGTYMVQRPQDADTFFVVGVNSGQNLGGAVPDRPNSGLHRMTLDSNAALTDVNDFNNLWVDFSDPTVSSQIGDVVLRDVLGIASDSDGNLYITAGERPSEGVAGGIYKITVDGAGEFDSITRIVDNLGKPQEIKYDPFTDTLVFNDRNTELLQRVNLDGTGLSTLATGVRGRGIWIVPTPGSIAVLAGASLLGVSRRRR